ncbi:putative PHD type zinc finger protein with BAH domain-containing protein, partial [Linderina pennispora]
MTPEYPEEPYYIGRVMEFAYVPRVRQPKPLVSTLAQSKSSTSDARRAKRDERIPSSVQLRVRLGWFQRPRDLPLTRVRAKDTRLLVATMYSDLNPVSAIKGKCFVRHTSEIANQDVWKEQPHHYYYSQLFDRYSTRLYDIIPVSQIRNAPQEVLQKLHDTYQFIFAENQKITDLINMRRACIVCAKWCSISESLKCSVCEKHYHMQCLDPPITRKPSKGYSWQCAACMRRIQARRLRESADVSTDEAPSDTNEKRTTRQQASNDDNVIALRSAHAQTQANASDNESRSGNKRIRLAHNDSRHTDGAGTPVPRPRNLGLWPFRYFGINTNIDDVLHDDERIYPRAVSRIGPKYQAIIPEMVSPSGPELDQALTQKRTDYMAKHGLTEMSSLRESLHGSGRHGGHRGKDMGKGHTKNAEQLDRVWDEIEIRRGNHDEQLFFRQPPYLPDDELDMYIKSIVPFLRRHFEPITDFTILDCQDAALHGLSIHNYDVEEALILIPESPESYIRPRAPGDIWTAETLSRFDDSLREYGSNLQSIHNGMRDTTRRAITLHYYLIRHSSRGKHLLEAYDNRSHAGLRRPNLGQGESAGNVHHEVSSDAGVSSVDVPASTPQSSGMVTRDHSVSRDTDSSATQTRCLNCHRERASRWFPAPFELIGYNTRSSKASGMRRLVCGDCRDYWNYYATMPDQDTINARKHIVHHQTGNGHSNNSASQHPHQLSRAARAEERSRAKARAQPAAVVARPRNSDLWPLVACALCTAPTDSSQPAMACQDCGMCVHMGCAGYHGAQTKLAARRWRCAVCTNLNNPAISINYTCILCRKEVDV